MFFFTAVDANVLLFFSQSLTRTLLLRFLLRNIKTFEGSFFESDRERGKKRFEMQTNRTTVHSSQSILNAILLDECRGGKYYQKYTNNCRMVFNIDDHLLMPFCLSGKLKFICSRDSLYTHQP